MFNVESFRSTYKQAGGGAEIGFIGERVFVSGSDLDRELGRRGADFDNVLLDVLYVRESELRGFGVVGRPELAPAIPALPLAGVCPRDGALCVHDVCYLHSYGGGGFVVLRVNPRLCSEKLACRPLGRRVAGNEVYAV